MKVWKTGESGEPKFPSDFEVIKKAVLQVTDIKTNRNKYYAIELHSAKNKYRVFTHYGRTDDLDSNPNAGMRESRYCTTSPEAEALYNKILKEKTSPRKGYKEVNLASSKIGSQQSIGKSCGIIDDKTLKKLADKSPATTTPIIIIPTDIQELVAYLYKESTNALVSTVNASITANGIETPLGVLTIGQIDNGQKILDELIDIFNKKKTKSKNKSLQIEEDIVTLSGDFYTVIPHRFGRSRAAANEAVIDTLEKLSEKQDTLQLMRDMLNVNGNTGVLMNPEVDKKYKALNCTIEPISNSSSKYKELKEYVEKSQVRTKVIKIKNIYSLYREGEQKEFKTAVGNVKKLFHGSSTKNWVGILSRGLLLPKIVVSLGVHRTDAGWLGNGIYFGDSVNTASNYAGQGSRGTKFMTIAEVALGKVKDYHKITYGLSGPPSGFDSCHGVRRKTGVTSQFDDDEFVIYDSKQQKLDYLVEFSDY